MKKILLVLLFLPVFTNAQKITTFAGGGATLGDGGPATAALVVDPIGGSFDKYGNYYFAEGTGKRVRKVSTVGIINTIAGTGSGGFSGDGGPATSALIDGPQNIILDTFGNLYIADLSNERIRKVDIATGIITTICGNGTGAYFGDGGPATAAEIWGPQDICFDKFGNLYIADAFNYRVRKINSSGIISTFAGSGIFSATGTGDGGPATAATFNLVMGLAADDTGNIYIADYNSGKVRKVNTIGIITTIAGNGTPTYIGDGIPATNAQIAPLKLGFDHAENLFIADEYNLRVYKVDLVGILYNIAGDGASGYSGDGGPATTASIYYPAGIAFDQCGNLYIPDVNNKRVRKVIFDSTGVPTISISPNPNDTVCTGSSVTYTAAVSYGSAIAYQWYVDGTVTGATGSAYTFTPVNGDSIRCILTGISQCSGDTNTVSSNTVYMAVTPIPHPVIDSTPCCSVPNVYSSYQWYLEGGPLIPGATTNTYVNFGSWYVVVDSAGCSGQSNIFYGGGDGINNINSLNQITISPNPATTSLTIRYSGVTLSGVEGQITITNLLGQTLYQQTMPASCNLLQVDISPYPPGIYLLKINGTEVRKFVKE